jgi:hypothetical protein
MDTLNLKTTIDQHIGNHSSGGREMRLTDIVTRYTDYMTASDALASDLAPADRKWWEDTLSAIHAVRVEIAELDAEIRGRVEDAMGTNERVELEDLAGWMRARMAEIAG